MRLGKVSFFGHEFTKQVVLPELEVIEYTFADLVSDVLQIPVEAGTFVMAVGHLVTTAFTGGTPALKIGDGANDDGYGVSADIPLTLNGYYWSGGATTEVTLDDGGTPPVQIDVQQPLPFAIGKFYAAADAIKLTHAASLAAGAGKIFLYTFKLEGNWRVPDL